LLPLKYSMDGLTGFVQSTLMIIKMNILSVKIQIEIQDTYNFIGSHDGIKKSTNYAS
jgi:hypothetical protein